jgi:hypothetical protein
MKTFVRNLFLISGVAKANFFALLEEKTAYKICKLIDKKNKLSSKDFADSIKELVDSSYKLGAKVTPSFTF